MDKTVVNTETITNNNTNKNDTIINTDNSNTNNNNINNITNDDTVKNESNFNFEKEYIEANKLKRNIESLSQELNIPKNSYTTPNPLSKRQRKKKLREEKWAAHAEERRLKRIQKRKEIKEKRRMEKKLGILKKPPRIRECEQTPSPMRVVIDESFDNLMMEKVNIMIYHIIIVIITEKKKSNKSYLYIFIIEYNGIFYNIESNSFLILYIY